jgi:uncharacterized membrane protein YgcG
MTTVIIVLIVLFLIIFISRSKSKKSQDSSAGFRSTNSRTVTPAYESTTMPALLGIQPHLHLEPAAARLEQALPEEFTAKLRERALSRYPQMSEAEYNWKLLELKRYFLMTAVLREVPMFSDAVDDLWHEMLMFTREYSKFGEAFLGASIHHGPHSDGQPDPGGRAWFDWVYAQMFIPTPYSGRIWKPFFRHPLDASLLEQLRQSSEAELIAHKFNRTAAERYPEIRETVLTLIRKAKEQAAGAATGAAYTAERPGYESAAYMPYLAGALMFYSATEFTDFNSLMEPHFAEEEARRRAQEAGSSNSSCGSSSGCSAGPWYDNDNDSNRGSDGSGSSDSGGDSGGGSSSGCSSSSSCSSSSCGGGGD